MKYYLLREDVQFPERWYLGDIKHCNNWLFPSWRGSLLPLGCVAAAKKQVRCAAQREQAPSPQGLWLADPSHAASPTPSP
jgi:hypothetical protein